VATAGDHGKVGPILGRLEFLGRRNRSCACAAAWRLGQESRSRQALFEPTNVYVFLDQTAAILRSQTRAISRCWHVAKRFKGDPQAVSMGADEMAYICDAANGIPGAGRSIPT